MNKKRLQSFIQKYYLNGLVEGTAIVCKDSSIQTDFITEDRSMMGHVKYNDVSIENGTYGIFDTTMFSRMLSVLDSNMDIHVVKIDDKPINLSMQSNGTVVTALLADLSVIPDVPKLQKIPEFGLKVKLTDDFVNTYIKSKTALPEADTFTILPDATCKFVLGMSNTNTNRISIPVKAEISDPLMEQKVVNANVFKELLTCNRESEGIAELSDAGLLRVTFQTNDYTATYYMKTLENE
tara:strand:+ start:44 stop:757 length:714 start_codon:yes stop_codon:yes gene_type:complete